MTTERTDRTGLVLRIGAHAAAALVALVAWLMVGPMTARREATIVADAGVVGDGPAAWTVRTLDPRDPSRVVDAAWMTATDDGRGAGVGAERVRRIRGTVLLPWDAALVEFCAAGGDGAAESVRIHGDVRCTIRDRVLGSSGSESGTGTGSGSGGGRWWGGRTYDALARTADGAAFAGGDPVVRFDIAGAERSLGGATLARRARGEALLAVLVSQFALLACGRLGRGLVDSSAGRVSRLERAALAVVALPHAALAVTTPLFYPPDGVDYLVAARDLLETRSFAGFAPYRLPGFPLMLMPLLKAADWAGLSPAGFNTLLGGLQAGMVVLTAWLCGSIARRLYPRPWPAIVVLLVGLSPVGALYQRTALTESAAALSVVGVVWMAMTRDWWSRGVSRAVVGSIAAGLVVAAGAYVRGNLQVMLVVAPALLMTAGRGGGGARGGGGVGGGGEEGSHSARRGRWTCAATAALIPLVALAAMGPWLLRQHATYGRAQMVVLSDFKRCISRYDAGLVGPNLGTLFTPTQWAHAMAEREHGRLGGYQFIDALVAASGPGTTAGDAGDPWRLTSLRCAEAVRLSDRRDPPGRWLASASAWVNLAGLGVVRTANYQENDWWARPLRGEPATHADNHWEAPDAFRFLPADKVRRAQAQSRHTIDAWGGSPVARVAGAWVSVVTPWRVVVGWAGLCGLGAAWVARDRRAFAVACLPLVHAGLVAVMLTAGEDRYQMPFEPLTVVAAAALPALVQRGVQRGAQRGLRRA